MSPKKSSRWSKKLSLDTLEAKSPASKKIKDVPGIAGVGFLEELAGKEKTEKPTVEEIPVSWQENTEPKPMVTNNGDSDKTGAVRDRMTFGLGILLWLLIIGGAGLSLYFFTRNTWKADGVKEAVVATPTPTPELRRVTKSTRIQVLNASGVSGTAGRLKKYLGDRGYESVEVGNADESQAKNQVNLPKAVEMSEDLSKALSDYKFEKIVFGVSSGEIVEILIGSE